MAEIISEPGRTFAEFSLMTGYTKKDCLLSDVSLETELAGVKLKIPFMSAAMTSVTGYPMSESLGKEGGMSTLPSKLSIEEQAGIVERIKNYEMGFVEDPETVREKATIEDALKKIEKFGHSKIPVVDQNNVFLGMFTREHYVETHARPDANIKEAMISVHSESFPSCKDASITVEQAKDLLENNDNNYLVVLDDQKRLVKLAFKKDIEELKIASAISTHGSWRERASANIEAGVDMLVIDTSDGYNAFVKEVLVGYKKDFGDVPICAGNFITYDGAMWAMKNGADAIKVGMAAGSICTTGKEKATGRAPMSALLAAYTAREDYHKETGRYVPIIIDGGISGTGDMIIALTHADAMMMGNYFNGFYEAAGEKFDKDGKITNHESEMVMVATWGEGSPRAQNMGRYSQTMKTWFAEGVEDRIPYKGRLKPNLKESTIKIKAALSNAGCRTLEEYRKNAVIQLNSSYANQHVKDTPTLRR